MARGGHVATERSFEDLLADPLEQFDPRSELLASILEYAAAPPACVSAVPPRKSGHRIWVYTDPAGDTPGDHG